MRLTVCQLPDDPPGLQAAWLGLVEHARQHASDLVLLPEMPFAPWFPLSPRFDEATWQAVLAAHAAWELRLAELAPAAVLASRPVQRPHTRQNEGYAWDSTAGSRAAHTKFYLPDEDGYWEASWYSRGDGVFNPLTVGPARVGFAICTELWAFERSRAYGKSGAHLIVSPRCTGPASIEKWLTGGRAAAIASGAYTASSNRVSSAGQPPLYGGGAWIVDPDGVVLALTSAEQPFATVEIDLAAADRARRTYPRYALD